MTADALAEGLPAEAGAKSVAEDAEEKSSRKVAILLVDDDVETRELMALILEELGYHVAQVANGAEALELAVQMAGAFDLLLTDVRMPGMSGVELASAMKVRFPKIPVLFVSAYAAGVLTDEEGAAPRGPFLAKPFSVDELDSFVRTALTGVVEGGR